MTEWHGGREGALDAPVFGWEWPERPDGGGVDTSSGLPLVWATRQEEPPREGRSGRRCLFRYDPADDPDGSLALSLGSDYYNEGMSCDGRTEHARRVGCFQAAEVLYLHSSRLGNAMADDNLSYVYSYDRCEGAYWDSVAAGAERPRQEESLDVAGRAFAHCRLAAQAGIAESCYKLGDFLRDGRGCEADLVEAYRWYRRSYELGRSEDPVFWGSAALRLGRAHEEGEGCRQSFEEARAWYSRAVTGLSVAVREGESWYRGSLRGAEAGLARVEQELAGDY